MKKLLFFFILLLAIILRFYKLDLVPPSLDWDEASNAYNAYSLLKTGNDEYGTRYPFIIRSFDDYKPPLYAYLTIIPVFFFGLNEFSARMVSAVFGVLAVFLTYFLVKELFKNQKCSLIISFLSMLGMAVSPWHLQFSRTGFEANVGLTVVIAAVYFLLRGREKGKYILISIFFFALSLYAYHSLRVFAPLIFLGTLLIFKKDYQDKIKWLALSLVLGLLMTTPYLTTLDVSLNRAKTVSRFSDEVELLKKDIIKIDEDKKSNYPFFSLFHNRRITYINAFIGGYLSHFDLNWLFFKGDNARHHAPDMGLLYYWELPMLIIGFVYFIKERDKNKMLVILWILLAPLAAAFTTGVPHAVRAMVFLPAIVIVSAFGLYKTMEILKWNKAAIAIMLFIISFNFYWYLDLYYLHLNQETSQFWQYGYKQSVLLSQKYYNSVNKIYVTIKYDQPYIYFLFYNQYDPLKYQTEIKNTKEFDRYKRSFDKYIFASIDFKTIPKNSLVIGAPDEVPEGNVIDKIYFLDGSEAFRIAVKK